MYIATRLFVVAVACLYTSTANFAAEPANPRQSPSRININRTALADLYTELADLGVVNRALGLVCPRRLIFPWRRLVPSACSYPFYSLRPGTETKVEISDQGLRLTDGSIIKDEGFNVIIRMSKSGTSVEAMEFSPTPLRVRYALSEFQDQ